MVKLIDGHVLQSWILAALAIYLEEDIFILKMVDLENIFKGLKAVAKMVLGYCCEACFVHMVHTIIGRARRFLRIDAVVLFVGKLSLGGNLAPKSIESIDSDVDHRTATADEIFTNQVSSFSSVASIHVPVSSKLTVGILHKTVLTL